MNQRFINSGHSNPSVRRGRVGRAIRSGVGLGAAVVLSLLAACEYAGPVDNPVARNLTWFSYIGGEDIKKVCGPGASDQYRFVYNGIYDKQIRAYDVRMLPDGRSAQITAFARSEPNLARSIEVTELGSLWSGKRVSATMPLNGVTALRNALRDDDFRGFRPVGLRMPSNEFYWTAAACVDGRFHTNAWLYPSERFRKLHFPAVLKDFDRTGVAFYEPRPVAERDEDPTLDGGDKSGGGPFNLQLGADGFVGTNAPF